jgi:hypothetical protein
MAPCNWPGLDGNKLVWGPPRDVEESIAVLRQAVASGVNVATITGDRGADIGTPIEQAYPAFNKRDIDGALALMTADVSLAQSFGGRQSDREERDPRLLDDNGASSIPMSAAGNHRRRGRQGPCQGAPNSQGPSGKRFVGQRSSRCVHYEHRPYRSQAHWR